MQFQLSTDYQPAGDQGRAIEQLCTGLERGDRYQTLKGVTGSGKTYTMAKVIERWKRPTLVLSHNKTLSAQLYREFKQFFPNNAVEYFVSYYDYYQPEAYVAKRDLYIDKDASINDEIERMRVSATVSLIERRDVVVVATVSCIYGLGAPNEYRDMRMHLDVDNTLDLDQLKRALIELQYERNDAILDRGNFRIRGDVIEIYPTYAERAYRIELDWDRIAAITVVHPLTGEKLQQLTGLTLYPAKHFVMPYEKIRHATESIQAELEERYAKLIADNKLVEAQRLRSRTLYDIEMLREMGFCSGIENYSRHFSGREAGSRPAVLLDYFPDDFLTFIDESHVTLPQLGGMYRGDRARKLSLVEYGFRLPSALDNRPLTSDEFGQLVGTAIFVSATPGETELGRAQQLVEQIIRPTGLLDPLIKVRPTEGQIEHLYGEISKRIAVDERTLVTTLTKKLAENLTDYLSNLGLAVRYIHSEIETIERVEILNDLRAGKFDVLIGINLLREGLDLPEVSLVAILDADKIGFLRSAQSLIQTIGRAARNINGTVLMYADRISDAMRQAIDETEHRRVIQDRFNREHNITPYSVKKALSVMLAREKENKRQDERMSLEVVKQRYNLLIPKQRRECIRRLEETMLEYAKNWEFEQAAVVRDEIEALRSQAAPVR